MRCEQVLCQMLMNAIFLCPALFCGFYLCTLINCPVLRFFFINFILKCFFTSWLGHIKATHTQINSKLMLVFFSQFNNFFTISSLYLLYHLVRMFLNLPSQLSHIGAIFTQLKFKPELYKESIHEVLRLTCHVRFNKNTK